MHVISAKKQQGSVACGDVDDQEDCGISLGPHVKARQRQVIHFLHTANPQTLRQPHSAQAQQQCSICSPLFLVCVHAAAAPTMHVSGESSEDAICTPGGHHATALSARPP